MIAHQDQPIDRSRWESGPWDNEPDFETFEHHGLTCRVRRQYDSGTLCCYVIAPKSADTDLVHANIDRGDLCVFDLRPEHELAETHVLLGVDHNHLWHYGSGPGCSRTDRSEYGSSYVTFEKAREECRRMADAVIAAMPSTGACTAPLTNAAPLVPLCKETQL